MPSLVHLFLVTPGRHGSVTLQRCCVQQLFSEVCQTGSRNVSATVWVSATGSRNVSATVFATMCNWEIWLAHSAKHGLWPLCGKTNYWLYCWWKMWRHVVLFLCRPILHPGSSFSCFVTLTLLPLSHCCLPAGNSDIRAVLRQKTTCSTTKRERKKKKRKKNNSSFSPGQHTVIESTWISYILRWNCKSKQIWLAVNASCLWLWLGWQCRC